MRPRPILYALLTLAAVPLLAFEIDKAQEVSSKKPVQISSDQLTFDRPRGMTLFTGNVKALHDRIILLTQKLQALEDNREASATGSVKVTDASQGITLTCGSLEYEDRMNLMAAHDHPILTTQDEKGKTIKVSGRQMELDSEKKTVTINQNVLIEHPEGKGESQRATFLSQSEQFILEDDPKFTTDNGVLTGRRIRANMGGDRGIVVEGMAEAYFNPNGKPVIPSKTVTPGPRPLPGVPSASVTVPRYEAPGVLATPGGPTSPFSR
jgi:lipopolysaccharide export system protein LptA